MRRRAVVLSAIVVLTALLVPMFGEPAGGADRFLAGRVRGSFQPNKGKIFVLVIGTDAREGNPTNVRADALHLIGVNTETMKGGILNFPRDSYVPIPGHGEGKINEALYQGGPELQVQTVEQLTGIEIDYYVMTGFFGFMKIIRRIGDVKVNLPHAFFDPGGSGADLPAGEQFLDPGEALSYVRTRKSLPGGDVERTTNQGKFLLALLRKLTHQVAQDPGFLFSWISATTRQTQLDVSGEELFRLGILAAEVEPGRVGNVTVPVSLGSVGAASVVFIQPGAEAIYRRFEKNGSL